MEWADAARADVWAWASGVWQLLAIAGVAFSIWWFMLASDDAKAALEETAAPVVGALASAWGWLLDALVALKDRIAGARSTARLAYCHSKTLLATCCPLGCPYATLYA